MSLKERCIAVAAKVGGAKANWPSLAAPRAAAEAVLKARQAELAKTRDDIAKLRGELVDIDVNAATRAAEALLRGESGEDAGGQKRARELRTRLSEREEKAMELDGLIAVLQRKCGELAQAEAHERGHLMPIIADVKNDLIAALRAELGSEVAVAVARYLRRGYAIAAVLSGTQGSLLRRDLGHVVLELPLWGRPVISAGRRLSVPDAMGRQTCLETMETDWRTDPEAAALYESLRPIWDLDFIPAGAAAEAVQAAE